MRRARRSLTLQFKSEVVRAALSGELSIEEVAERYDVDPKQVSRWKQQFGMHYAMNSTTGNHGLLADNARESHHDFQSSREPQADG
jgi:transposase-like protein